MTRYLGISVNVRPSEVLYTSISNGDFKYDHSSPEKAEFGGGIES
jgi:hypothetical protein